MDAVVLCLVIVMTAQQFLLSNGLDAVVCEKYPSYTETIDCGSDAIIDVHSIVVAYFSNCNKQNVINTMPHKSTKATLSASVGCHGSRRCDISSDDGVHYIGTFSTARTNTLYMKYDCLQLNTTGSAVLPINEDITNFELNIFSPNFPGRMPSSAFSFSCNIISDRMHRQEVKLKFVVEKLVIPSGRQCDEDFFISENGQARTNYCSSHDHQKIWQYRAAVTAPELSFTYKKQNYLEGGLFWLRITDSSDSSVNLRLTCSGQEQIPGYNPPTSTTPTPLTTTSTPTATPTTVTPSTVLTTATPSTTTGTETTASTAATGIGSNNPSSANQDQAGDADSKGVTTLLAALLCVAGLILIIVVVIIFLVMRIRKRKKHETDTDPSVMYSTAEPISESNGKIRASDVNANLYSEVREDKDPRVKGRPGNKHDMNTTQTEYEDVLNKNSDQMYAVVDKKGKNIEKKNIDEMYAVVDKDKANTMKNVDNDETVICENNDLYESGSNPAQAENKKNAPDDDVAEMYAVVDKRKSPELQDAEADETIVWENDDLYEAGPVGERQDDLYAVVDENRS